jgi:hypothetical protein
MRSGEDLVLVVWCSWLLFCVWWEKTTLGEVLLCFVDIQRLFPHLLREVREERNARLRVFLGCSSLW